ncbi:RHS repeat domain-containing protein [Variovorax sp. tm]|uniref:RHS repeat domain-containing protein n=1 Tax=Variovorax atrisoli TaxID=3394203 RepID=UPI003A7F800D
MHEPNSFVPLVQLRRASAMVLSETTDAKALMEANGGVYDIEQDPLWNGEQRQVPRPFDRREMAFYQCDHLGTPQELTDHEGSVAWSAQYKAWGEAREAISEAGRRAGFRNPIRFQGQYWDKETGLHYNRYRYYDPWTGRFVSRDPIGLMGGLNRHQFASNPLTWIDPLGLARKKGITPNDRGTRTTMEGGKLSEPAIGYSGGAGGKGAQNPVVKQMFDEVEVDQRSETHGWCGEPDALSKIADAHKVTNADELRRVVQGATSITERNDGKLLPYCRSCSIVMGRLGVCDGVKK